MNVLLSTISPSRVVPSTSSTSVTAANKQKGGRGGVASPAVPANGGTNSTDDSDNVSFDLEPFQVVVGTKTAHHEDDDDDDHEEEEDYNHTDAAAMTKKLGKKETTGITCLRIVHGIVLLSTTLLCSIATYHFSRRDEIKQFQLEFESSSTKILDEFHDIFERKLAAIDGMSNTMTSYALSTNAKFPNVTYPHFEIRGSSARIQSDALSIAFSPIVTDETRIGYEEYMTQNCNWIVTSFENESTLRIQQDENFNMDTNSAFTTMAKSEDEDAPLFIYFAPQKDTTTTDDNAAATASGGGGTDDTDSAIEDDGDNKKPPQKQRAPDGLGLYSPVWQMSPVWPTKDGLGLDLMSTDFRPAIQETINTGLAVLSPTFNLAGGERMKKKTTNGLVILDSGDGGRLDEDYADDEEEEAGDAITAAELQLGQWRSHTLEWKESPHSVLVYPVFDSFHNGGGGGEGRKVVGTLNTKVYWKLFLSHILPEDSKGIMVVIDNIQHDQTFSYRIDGGHAEFVGRGDHHDPRYDNDDDDTDDVRRSMNVQEDVMQTIQDSANPWIRSYTAVDLDGTYSRYTLRIYPTREMESRLVTNMPYIHMAVVIAIFFATTVLFIVYDYLVERRQSIVLESALTSGAIVSSLYPETVRDRILEETKEKRLSAQRQEQQKKKMMKNGKNKSSTSSKTFDWRASSTAHHNSDATLTTSHMSGSLITETMMIGRNSVSTDSSESHGTDGGGRSSPPLSPTTSKPIADKFLNTTIIFADLAGFTQWSSTRQPEDVFTLLETLYNAFDKIATKRKVFKVETIGDCYVAVTGLPKPQEDHAVIIVKFANECLHKTTKIVNKLSKTALGADTAELMMRIGLHSGEVTAGILRGQKSRFQLFGDSMNTASRMESNGVKGKIHVSSHTASELMAKGYSHWVTPREDKIHAKGKGLLQTYWVTVPLEEESNHSSSKRLSSCGSNTGWESMREEEDPVEMMATKMGSSSNNHQGEHHQQPRSSSMMLASMPTLDEENEENALKQRRGEF